MHIDSYHVYYTAILATAKYCNEHVYVCVCVCMSVSISSETHFTYFTLRAICMLPMAVARSSSGGVTQSQGNGQFLGFSSSLTIHCKGRISV